MEELKKKEVELVSPWELVEGKFNTELVQDKGETQGGHLESVTSIDLLKDIPSARIPHNIMDITKDDDGDDDMETVNVLILDESNPKQ